MKKYIIRADYYSNGAVVPLGITDERGNTFYINKFIIKRMPFNKNRYHCIANGRNFILETTQSTWSCIEKK